MINLGDNVSMRVEPEEPELGRDFELSIHSLILFGKRGWEVNSSVCSSPAHYI